MTTDRPTADDLSVPAERDEISGIPVFRTKVAGAFEAALIFRVGYADETLVTSGITHLVEHLAMPPTMDQTFELNGFVEDLRTIFYARGTREEVLGFLADTAAALANLPLERLENERRILRAEAAQREGNAFTALLARRFGAVRHGLTGVHELGLRNVDEEAVRAWARERFTSGNAAIWMSGAGGHELELPLPPGRRFPPPEPQEVPGLELPAWDEWGRSGVAFSTLGERGSALNVGGAIVLERARRVLRSELGISYDPGGSYQPLTADAAYVFFAADSLPERTGEARDALLGLLDDLAANGPTDEELRFEVEAARRSMSDEDGTKGWLDACATDELFGMEVLTRRELLERREAVTRDEVRETARAMLNRAIFLIGADHELPGERFHRLPDPPQEVVDGRSYRSTDSRRFGTPKAELRIGDEGVSLVVPPEEWVGTMRYDELVAFLRWPDGSRLLWHRHGARLRIDPREWRGAEEAIRQVDEAVPRALVVEMEAGEDLVE